MKGIRILVGIMAISLGLGATGSALAQRGGGGHGGSGGTPMMHRDFQGSAGAAGTRERQRDMVQEHRQMNREEGMQQQSRHEFTQRQGEPRRHDGDNNGQQAETREHRMERSDRMEHPSDETQRGPSDQASPAAHEAFDHRGEGTGTAAAVHEVNSQQNRSEERKEIMTGQ